MTKNSPLIDFFSKYAFYIIHGIGGLCIVANLCVILICTNAPCMGSEFVSEKATSINTIIFSLFITWLVLEPCHTIAKGYEYMLHARRCREVEGEPYYPTMAVYKSYFSAEYVHIRLALSLIVLVGLSITSQDMLGISTEGYDYYSYLLYSVPIILVGLLHVLVLGGIMLELEKAAQRDIFRKKAKKVRTYRILQWMIRLFLIVPAIVCAFLPDADLYTKIYCYHLPVVLLCITFMHNIWTCIRENWYYFGLTEGVKFK